MFVLIEHVVLVCACCSTMVPFEGDDDKDFKQGRKKDHCGNTEHPNVNLLQESWKWANQLSSLPGRTIVKVT